VAFFPTGYATLSRKTGSPILPLFTIRKRFDKFEAIVGKPIKVECNNQDSMIQIINQFVKLFEEYVQKYPCHWHFWDKFEKLTISGTVHPHIEIQGGKRSLRVL
jgi:lauroyl/myristoyl acyltransferase